MKFLGKWLEVGNIILSDVSQTQKRGTTPRSLSLVVPNSTSSDVSKPGITGGVGMSKGTTELESSTGEGLAGQR